MTEQTTKPSGDTTIAKTGSFSVKIASHPHVTAEEGGHLFIEVNDSHIEDRTQLTGEQATELMWLTMVTGEAMTDVLCRAGLDVYRINYQDNGNWSFLRGERPRLHVHLYGRTRGESHQTFGQALVFPDPHDPVYEELVPVSEDIGRAIGEAMARLAVSDTYAWFTPHVLEFPLT